MKSGTFDPARLVFAAIVLLLVLWIGSGMLGRDHAPAAAVTVPTPVVAASWSEARPVDRRLVLYGEVEPFQTVTLRSRTDGLLEKVVSQGSVVAAGEEIAWLSSDDREARLAQARAQLEVAARNAEAARQLADRGTGPRLTAEARQAELEAARAHLRAVELDIENTRLRAPIDGVVDRLILDQGSYVAPGGEVLRIVRNDPLLAVVRAPQAEIMGIRPGMAATVRFLGGQETEGRVRFVAPLADAATRTFRVEIEIPNPGSRIPAGLSAEVSLVTATLEAHYISLALARLDAEGRLGVLVVDEESRARFRPVEVIAAGASGQWVSGLGRRARLVTISQGAIADGERVEARETPEEYALPVPPRDLPGPSGVEVETDAPAAEQE